MTLSHSTDTLDYQFDLENESGAQTANDAMRKDVEARLSADPRVGSHKVRLLQPGELDGIHRDDRRKVQAMLTGGLTGLNLECAGGTLLPLTEEGAAVALPLSDLPRIGQAAGLSDRAQYNGLGGGWRTSPPKPGGEAYVETNDDDLLVARTIRGLHDPGQLSSFNLRTDRAVSVLHHGAFSEGERRGGVIAVELELVEPTSPDQLWEMVLGEIRGGETGTWFSAGRTLDRPTSFRMDARVWNGQVGADIGSLMDTKMGANNDTGIHSLLTPHCEYARGGHMHAERAGHVVKLGEGKYQFVFAAPQKVVNGTWRTKA